MAVIKNVTPILRVEDLETSRCYYIQTLGFTLDWAVEGMVFVSRDGGGGSIAALEFGKH